MLARALFLFLISCISSVLAQADEPWRAPAGCPDRSDAERRLLELHADPTLLSSGRASVWIDQAPSGDRRARIELRHGARTEQRVLTDPECAELAEAALLVISLAFEDERGAGAIAPPAPVVRSHRLALLPLARLDVGSLPRPTLALGAALRWRVRRFTSELEGAYFLSRKREGQRASGEFGLATGTARACYGSWLAGCAAAELGVASGRGLDTPHDHKARTLWAAALAGVEVTLPLRHVSPMLDVEVGLPIARHHFDIAGAGALFETRAVIGRVALRLAIEL